MSGAKSTYLQGLVLQLVLTADAVSRPTSWHVALHTQDPTVAGDVGEVSGDGYARQSTTFTVSSGVASSGSELEFGPCSGSSWGNVSHYSIWSEAVSGECLYHGALDAQREVLVGDTVVIPSGSITVTES